MRLLLLQLLGLLLGLLLLHLRMGLHLLNLLLDLLLIHLRYLPTHHPCVHLRTHPLLCLHLWWHPPTPSEPSKPLVDLLLLLGS